MFGWNDPITAVKGVGPERAKQFATIGVETVGDMMSRFPRRYVDGTILQPIESVEEGAWCAVRGTIKVVKTIRTKSSRIRSMVVVQIADETGELSVQFFNQPHRGSSLPEGESRIWMGKVNRYKGKLAMISPRVGRIERVVPLYPQSNVVPSWVQEATVQAILEHGFDATFYDLPAQYGLETLSGRALLTGLHAPQSMEEVGHSQSGIGHREMVWFFHDRWSKGGREGGSMYQGANALEVPKMEDFPLEPTEEQRVAIETIIQRFTGGQLEQLLNGDVGTGKTLVAFGVLLAVLQKGKSAVVIAPTDVLAHQLYILFSNWCKPLGVEVGVYSARRKEAPENVRVMVGTHAVMYSGFTPPPAVGLVVIDEQHRFGVQQRALVKKWSGSELSPAILSLSATPIPRTLALTLLGEATSVELHTRPHSAAGVTTYVSDSLESYEVQEALRTAYQQREVSFVVVPRIEQMEEEVSRANIDETFQQISTLFPDIRVEVVHGGIAPATRLAILEAARAGEPMIIVATTVIEVGVDISHATVMVILDADRFGIAQLHQVRGRVGRSTKVGSCYLICSPAASPLSRERVAFVASTQDGFALAQYDLAQRGPGSFRGTEQSGLPDFHMAQLGDADWVTAVQQEARKLWEAGVHVQPPPQWGSGYNQSSAV